MLESGFSVMAAYGLYRPIYGPIKNIYMKILDYFNLFSKKNIGSFAFFSGLQVAHGSETQLQVAENVYSIYLFKAA